MQGTVEHFLVKLLSKKVYSMFGKAQDGRKVPVMSK